MVETPWRAEEVHGRVQIGVADAFSLGFADAILTFGQFPLLFGGEKVGFTAERGRLVLGEGSRETSLRRDRRRLR